MNVLCFRVRRNSCPTWEIGSCKSVGVSYRSLKWRLEVVTAISLQWSLTPSGGGHRHITQTAMLVLAISASVAGILFWLQVTVAVENEMSSG